MNCSLKLKKHEDNIRGGKFKKKKKKNLGSKDSPLEKEL